MIARTSGPCSMRRRSASPCLSPIASVSFSPLRFSNSLRPSGSVSFEAFTITST